MASFSICVSGIFAIHVAFYMHRGREGAVKAMHACMGGMRRAHKLSVWEAIDFGSKHE